MIVRAPVQRAWLAARPQLADLLVWWGLVAAGLGLTGLSVALSARVGVGAPPFAGRYDVTLRPIGLSAVSVAVAVLCAARSGLVERIRFRWVAVLGWAAATAWSVLLGAAERGGLGAALAAPDGYLADRGAVHGHVSTFLRTFVRDAPGYGTAARTHPPGALLLVTGLRDAGLHDPAALEAVLLAIGALAVPAVAVATRSLCHERAGRRIVPLLALAPWWVWAPLTLDTDVAAISGIGIACGVLASERTRGAASRRLLTAASGLFLGLGAMLSYSAAWIAVAVIAVQFVRRRPGLIVLTALWGLVPLALARIAGFTWADGLAVAQHDFSVRLGPHRSWPLWVVLDLVLLLIITGPAVIAATRGTSRTPGWPFLVGSGAAMVFALVAGLARGEVERSWIPYAMWLLVPAVAPLVRPADSPDPDAPDATPVPLLLAVCGAVVAVVLRVAVQPSV
ncbi:MAG TPA: hypothetical protein VHE83_18105 [Mycobacteriales bacterium]|nr:hypothetical protein [Mycobacteriales bacterium]